MKRPEVVSLPLVVELPRACKPDYEKHCPFLDDEYSRCGLFSPFVDLDVYEKGDTERACGLERVVVSAQLEPA